MANSKYQLPDIEPKRNIHQGVNGISMISPIYEEKMQVECQTHSVSYIADCADSHKIAKSFQNVRWIFDTFLPYLNHFQSYHNLFSCDEQP